MDRWLTLSFQVGHVCRSLGETLLTLHEVMTYGTHAGRSALPQRGQATTTNEGHRAERETGERTARSSEREDPDNEAQARSELRGHPGSNQENEQQSKEEVKGNGQLAEPEALETLLEGGETGVAI